MKTISSLVCCASIAASLATSHAYADNQQDSALLKLLQEKGILSAEEAKSLQAEQAQRAQQQASVSMGSSGLKIESADKQTSVQIGGRLHADYATHDHETLANQQDAIDGTQIRRARLYVKGKLNGRWKYVLESDFAGNKVSVKDAGLSYKMSSAPITLTVGNQKHAVSMEVEESSNDIMFTERSLVSALTTPYFDRAIGITAASGGSNWHAKAGIFGDGISNNDADEGHGFGARASFAPVLSDNTVVHLGASYGLRKTSDDGLANGKSPSFSYKTTNFSDLKPVKASVADMDKVEVAVLEFAAMQGAWSLQSEIAANNVNRDSGDDLSFSAHYVQLGYSIFGGQRRYKASEGEFKYFNVNTPFNASSGDWGALEVAARFDQIDLEDDNVSGGKAKRFTLGLNWYLSRNMRVLFDYSRSYDLDGGAVQNANGDVADNIDSFAIRTQWAF